MIYVWYERRGPKVKRLLNFTVRWLWLSVGCLIGVGACRMGWDLFLLIAAQYGHVAAFSVLVAFIIALLWEVP